MGVTIAFVQRLGCVTGPLRRRWRMQGINRKTSAGCRISTARRGLLQNVFTRVDATARDGAGRAGAGADAEGPHATTTRPDDES
jgi:hypothetical protein